MIGIFPCRNCIVLACCTKICKKISEMNRTHITKSLLYNKICPDCGNKDLRYCNDLYLYGTTEVIRCIICKHDFYVFGKSIRRVCGR